MKGWPRVVAAGLLANALGFGAWRLALAALPWLWSGVDESTRWAPRLGLMAASAIAVAAPPVLVGALGAWLAGRHQVWVGALSGLWAVTLIGPTPAYFLTIAPGVWYAPALLIVISGLFGGWMLDLRAQAAQPPRA